MINEPVALFRKGYKDLISVIPPNATLAPTSKITASQMGKVPGLCTDGVWHGYNWRAWETAEDHVKYWTQRGANIGLRAGNFPGLDIDSMDESVGDLVRDIALARLGPAPTRYGKRPKRLLLYRTKEPMARMRMWLEKDGATHLVELLGEGQQYLVYGTHPGTMKPYEWDQELPPAKSLSSLDRAKVEDFFAALSEHARAVGFKVTREGDGRDKQRAQVSDQTELRAPSLDALLDAVQHIPNTDEHFPTREDYIKMGYAIRAACGEDLEEGYSIFLSWAQRWDNPKGNDEETVRGDWRRMRPPFSVGWGWIAATAQRFGFQTAEYDFEADPDATPPPELQAAVTKRARYTDQWLAERVVRNIGERIRFAPETGRWLVWDSRRWKIDETLKAQAEIGGALLDISKGLLADSTSKANIKEARSIESFGTLSRVMSLVKADRTIAVTVASLDADPWLLNTPAGIVDLRTGATALVSADKLCTRTTLVGPDASAACPLWLRHIKLATGGDRDLGLYLQRLAGYCLTGVTREQVFIFLYGDGGNGKGTFVDALRNIMGDYGNHAAMDTFTATNFDRHTTDLADLMGARLVTASETQGGRRWDEQRIKQLTGGDPVKARFMRQDNFTYTPAFKLLFMGNHKPQLRDVDEAMRRRTHLVPFEVRLKDVLTLDREYAEKLKPEYPAILQWAIEGCLEWQKQGLNPPESILAKTQEYFDDENTIGRWIRERCVIDDAERLRTSSLYSSWREWTGLNGEYCGSIKRFSQMLTGAGFKRYETNAGSHFKGLRLKELGERGEEQ